MARAKKSEGKVTKPKAVSVKPLLQESPPAPPKAACRLRLPILGLDKAIPPLEDDFATPPDIEKVSEPEFPQDAFR